MEKITGIFNKLDELGKLVPEMDKLLDVIYKCIKLSVRVGPLCILVLGLIYLLIPPNEANHKAGYRTFFGMGSVGAWRFTQFVAGFIMTITGLVLNIKASATVRSFAGFEPEAMVQAALPVIKGQIICVLVIFVFMSLLTFVMFTVKGKLRFKGLRGTLFEKVLFHKHPVRFVMELLSKEDKQSKNAPAEAPKTNAQIPGQDEQPLSAEDIVIEEV